MKRKTRLWRVKVYRDRYSYLVNIDGSLYEMNEQATSLNGVNTYMGPASNYQLPYTPYREIFFGEIPEVILRAIALRQEQNP